MIDDDGAASATGVFHLGFVVINTTIDTMKTKRWVPAGGQQLGTPRDGPFAKGTLPPDSHMLTPFCKLWCRTVNISSLHPHQKVPACVGETMVCVGTVLDRKTKRTAMIGVAPSFAVGFWRQCIHWTAVMSAINQKFALEHHDSVCKSGIIRVMVWCGCGLASGFILSWVLGCCLHCPTQILTHLLPSFLHRRRSWFFFFFAS